MDCFETRISKNVVCKCGNNKPLSAGISFAGIDFIVMLSTLLSSLLAGLEVGLIFGLGLDVIRLLYTVAKPTIDITIQVVCRFI